MRGISSMVSGHFVLSMAARLSIPQNHSELLKKLWAGSIVFLASWFVGFYALPLVLHFSPYFIPLKSAVEGIVCTSSFVMSVLYGAHCSRVSAPEIEFEDTYLILRNEEHIIGTSCLEIESIPGSVYVSESGSPRYNESILLALRSGMDDSVSIAFEVGVVNSSPFMRFFISTRARSLDEVRRRIRRESTRIEAILLASLGSVNLSMLEGDSLSRAVFQHRMGFGARDREERVTSLFIVRGKPRVFPRSDASQVGTFLSTLLKQGISASMTCVFSGAGAGREKKRLESKWRTIQSKEKRKEDTLSDYTEKKRIINQYEEIEDNVGWFNTSVYFIVVADSEDDLEISQESVRSLVLSIWAEGNSLRLSPENVTERTRLRLISRVLLKKMRIHASRLVSFVNTPVQKLPRMLANQLIEFPVPPQHLVSHELTIGKVVYDGRPLSTVGLKLEWLREHVVILGATGTGKTTLVKRIVAEVSAHTDVPWWIFDVKGDEYSQLARITDASVLRPGLDSSFVVDLLDPECGNGENSPHSTFVLLRELLNERGESSELSPAMEKLLRSAVLKASENIEQGNSLKQLEEQIIKLAGNTRTGIMTRDALLNRLEILFREPLGSILSGGPKSIDISKLLQKRVICDLRHVARKGGMESARFLYNLIAKRIFDYAMKRGIVPGLHHIVVLEEASNLVPESYIRHSSADVTTGESMVMLQRATGQGVIVVSTRPNISSNILANTSTKIVFRLPYDSQEGAKFLSLNEEQEVYLRGMQRGRALVAIPHAETFEIATEPFDIKEIEPSEHAVCVMPDTEEIEHGEAITDLNIQSEEENTGTPHGLVFDRIGEIASHLVAHLASAESATENELRRLIFSLDSSIRPEDVSALLRNLVSLGTIDRETISLVTGGVLFTLPGKGLEAIRTVILKYVVDRLENKDDVNISDIGLKLPDLIINERAVLIVPQHLKSSSLSAAVERIDKCMEELGTGISELFVIVRGSVAAAKLRELLRGSDRFDAVTVVSAFPSSMESMLESLNHGTSTEALESKQSEEREMRADDGVLLESIHDMGTATSRAVQIRLWFGLIQDFVNLSEGVTEWEMLLSFIETTALQSLKGRSAPLTQEEGRRALTELLADEVLTAVRIGVKSEFVGIKRGLWVVNSSVLKEIKERVLRHFELEFGKRDVKFHKDHGYYDFCVGNTSYVIFPNQQQLNTLLNLHSDVACRKCESTRVVCILSASEYLEDSVVTPRNLVIVTLDDNVMALTT